MNKKEYGIEIKPSLTLARKRLHKITQHIKFNMNPNLVNSVSDKTYLVKTYGCQGNLADSEKISGILEQMGFKKAEDEQSADLVIFNTCAIRANAENRVFGELGRIKRIKKAHPDMIIGICGCMMQEEETINIIQKKYPHVDIIFGTHNITNLPEYVSIALAGKKVIDVKSVEGDIYEDVPVIRDHPYKAWVDIMYGCDEFCTYCIVPYTRGKQRSRLPEYIINEVKELVKEGYLEVTLLGQNVNAYGKDLDINYNMANLLEDVAKTGIKIVRFLTSHPWDFTDDMIEVIKNNSNIMPHIHLPLQSGSDKILKLMGRRYTKEDYIKLYNKLKENIPNCAITTDIIVGFPNETEEDFNETLDVVNKCQFDSAFTFIFSPRVGTPAAKMKDNVDIETKEKRLQQLNELINYYALEANKKYLNKTVTVLIEGFSEKKDGLLFGYTDTMKLVNVKGEEKYIGKIVDVKITETKTWSLDGKIC